MLVDPLPATERQREVLFDILPDASYDEIMAMSRADAHAHISHHVETRRRGPATQRQEAFLRRWGRWHPGLTRGQAHELIADIKARTAHLSPADLAEAMASARQAAVLLPNQPADAPGVK
jgi:hypothetical protein